MVTEKMPKNAEKYECEICDFICCKKSNYDKHLLTDKHIGNTIGNTKKMPKKVLEKVLEKVSEIFQCKNCKKIYKSRKGLWGHNKKCITNDSDNTNENENKNTNENENKNKNNNEKNFNEIKILTNLVLEMMKSNTELQKQLVDVCKNTSTNINNSHNTQNSHNKTFNLQFFLNEQCKDAMNMSDFVNTFELQLSDLESVGDLGYVEGISKIIVERLNSLDIYKRPMHCSDAKREILYIKDADKWEKEERNNPKLRKAIQTVSFKNIKLITTWSDTYPESKNNESRLNDRYMKLIKQSTGGNGESSDNEDKIIRRIAKEIVIDK